MSTHLRTTRSPCSCYRLPLFRDDNAFAVTEGSPPSTTQHPEDEAFPTIASSRALVETAAAGKAAPLAAAPAALPASLSPTAGSRCTGGQG